MRASSRSRIGILLAAAFGVMLQLAGCGGGSDTGGGDVPPPVGVQPTLSSLWSERFSSCGLVCHNPSDVGNGTAPGPDLRTQMSFYDDLLERTVNQDYPDWVRAGTCNDVEFINPGDPVRSTLVASLIVEFNDQLKIAENCDSSWFFHNQNNVRLSQDEADALVAWVENGAPNN